MSLFGSGDQELNVTIKANTADATNKLNTLGASVGKLAAGFTLGTAITKVAGKAYDFVAGVVSDSIHAFEESEKVVAQLNSVLQSTGHAAGLSAKELIDLSQQMQSLTTYSDEAVLSAENMLLTFTNISASIFPDATKSVLDMSTALGQDLSSSAIQLGKALNDPINGVNALARVGVNFSDKQKEVIATMVKTGDTLGAQKLILQELSKEFGGSAVAQAKTFEGQMKQLANTIDDVEEGIGHGLTGALNNVFIAFSHTSEGMSKNVDVGRVVFKTFSSIAEFAAASVTAITQLGGTILQFGSYVVEAFDIVGVALDGDGKKFDAFRSHIDDAKVATVSFTEDLLTQNALTDASWNDLSQDSQNYADLGPKAYEETAAAAAESAQKMKEAAQKVIDANKAITDSAQALADLTSDHDSDTADSRKAAAEEYVAQEQRVKDLKKQLAAEDDDEQRTSLRKQLNEEKKALDSKKAMQTEYSTEISEARRRAGETDFERTLEDIAASQAADDAAFLKKQSRVIEEIGLAAQKRDALASDETSLTSVVIAESAKRTSAVTSAANAQVAQYARIQSASFGAYSPSVSGSTPMTLPHFANGGIVPGLPGAAVPAIVHAGEEVIPADRVGGKGTPSIYFTTTINNPQVTTSDPNILRRQVEAAFRDVTRGHKLTTT